jgi:hypothetical protein
MFIASRTSVPSALGAHMKGLHSNNNGVVLSGSALVDLLVNAAGTLLLF